MKKLLIVPMLFFCFLSLGQTVNSASIVGKSIKIGSLEVAQNDFPNQMKWDDAEKACAALGSGWRLPTKDELYMLYSYKGTIGGFADRFYWSSMEKGGTDAWFQHLGHGYQYFTIKNYLYNIRAVRTI
jgi:hypothetical protein